MTHCNRDWVRIVEPPQHLACKKENWTQTLVYNLLEWLHTDLREGKAENNGHRTPIKHTYHEAPSGHRQIQPRKAQEGARNCPSRPQAPYKPPQVRTQGPSKSKRFQIDSNVPKQPLRQHQVPEVSLPFFIFPQSR